MGSEFDSPWLRLPWTLGGALLVWAMLMWLFGTFLSKPEAVPARQKPIDAKLIDMPASKPASSKPSPVQRIRAKAQPAKPVAKPAPQAKTSPPAKPAPPSPPNAQSSEKGMENGNEMGARAIYSPKPEIPDEFRQDAMDVLVVARFHIAEDGSARVELVISTPLPALNRAVLDTLNTWKFFPALKDGKPVSSVQEVRFRLEVE